MALKKNPATPILGRVGPITLTPHEHRGGTVPISTLFPDLSMTLKTGVAVRIRWKYWTGVKSPRSAPFKGAVVISRDPCGDQR